MDMDEANMGKAPPAVRLKDEAWNLDPHEAARVLGVSEKTLATLRCNGGGPRFRRFLGRGKNGRMVRYARETLVEWMRLQPEFANTLEAAIGTAEMQ
jgi:hypothetical protein